MDLLLKRGLDVNTREKGDNTYAMHWAAAAGHLDIVRRLADAGGDVVGHGDDHELEVIGWATCWEGCDDAAIAPSRIPRQSRRAAPHLLRDRDEPRGRSPPDRGADPAALNAGRAATRTTSCRCISPCWKNRPEMVALLLELGADPLAVDGRACRRPPTRRARHRPARDGEDPRLTSAELVSAARGHRPPAAA